MWGGGVVEVVGLQLKCPFCKAHYGEFTLLFLPCILKENLFVCGAKEKAVGVCVWGGGGGGCRSGWASAEVSLLQGTSW